GAAFGGGIGSFMDQATLNVNNTAITGNLAQGGGGTFGDGSGGGIAVFQTCRASISGVTLAGNRAMGGSSTGGTTASDGDGGAILVGLSSATTTPGFVFPDTSSLAIRTSSITGNLAIGGAGTTAGNGIGGGIDLAGGLVTMETTLISANTVRGGPGS